ncbi:MAG: GIY-YIG nuclease family protein [Pararhodobacter sp.]|nr:GIY-YIG nuclease family protein [Pararhodobacter sp.]
MIKNYGLFWRRDGVHWATQGSGLGSGHLKGFVREAKENWPVDFRRQVGVYCLYDDAFNLLYVGKANSSEGLYVRLNKHRSGDLAERWSKFSWFGLKPVNWESDEPTLVDPEINPDTETIVRALEGVLILGAEPRLNRQGTNFGGAMKFDQYRDLERVYPTPGEMIEQIWESVLEE